MIPYAVLIVASFMLSAPLTLAIRTAARRLGAVDGPDGFRKVQKSVVPRLGGIGIYVAFFGAMSAGALWRCPELLETPTDRDRLLMLFAGATAVVMIGAWDDLARLRARWKLALLTLVAVAMYAGGYRIRGISNPLGEHALSLGAWALPVTLLWFLGCMNAINLIDGLDGLAGGASVFMAVTVLLTSLMFRNTVAALLCAALIGSALGFLVFNFPPASIYLGDSGSYLLGFVVASIGMCGSQKSSVVVSLLIPLIAMGLPVMDTSLAILRRWSRSLPIGEGDRQHIHHKLLNLGFTPRQAVLTMYVGCLVLAGFALLMTAVRDLQAGIVLALLALVTFVAVEVIGRPELRLAKQHIVDLLRRRKERLACRTAGYIAQEKILHAESVDQAWTAFADAATVMELDSAVMTLGTPKDKAGDLTFTFLRRGAPSPRDPEYCGLWTGAMALNNDKESLGQIHVRKATNGLLMCPDVPEMMEMLRVTMADRLGELDLDPAGKGAVTGPKPNGGRAP